MIGQWSCLRHIDRLFRTIRPLVGDDEFNIAPPTDGPISLERTNGSQIVRFKTKPVFVKLGDRSIHDFGRIELLQRTCAGTLQPRRLKLKECLIGRDLAGLPGLGYFILLQRLPAAPTELVVIPHVDEWPAGPRILNIRIVQVSPIDCTIIIQSRRNVTVVDLFAIRIANHVAEAPIVHSLRPVLRVPHHFIDEVAQMQHEVQAITIRCLLILKDHPAIGILRALIRILTTHKSKFDWPRIV